MTQPATRVRRPTSAALRYLPADWALVRAPLKPIEFFTAMSEGEGALDRVLNDPAVSAALTVGSTAVVDALQRSGAIETDSRMARTLHHYMVRMSTRPTPYGLFAGVGIITWGDHTDIMLGEARPVTRTRPDMKWLMGLVADMESDIDVRRHLSYIANATLVAKGGRLVVCVQDFDDKKSDESTVSIRATRVVRRAIELARTPINHSELAARLVRETGSAPDKVESLIAVLWQRHLLHTDLRPPLTQRDPARYVAQRLGGIAAASDAHSLLQRVLDAAADWDGCPLPEAPRRFRELAAVSRRPAKEWSAQTPQVDMALPLARNRVCRRVADDAARAAETLLRLADVSPRRRHIAEYRNRFDERYGYQRRVPVLELLDPDLGLGSPYVTGQGTDEHRRAAQQQVLMSLAVDALRDRRSVIDLDDETLTSLGSESPQARGPHSLDISVFVVSASVSALDAGEYQVVVGPNLGAESAGRTLGRFVDLLGAPAQDAIADISARESALSPGVVFAELVYAPGSARSANVAVRLHGRTHEVVIGAAPGSARRRAIALEDLSIESHQGRLRIWWSAEDTEIIVTAGHMLNPVSAPDVCRFLVDLRHDGQVPFAPFNWGSAAILPRLPRVQVGRIVLCPARYSAATLVGSAKRSDSTARFAEAVHSWRRRWDVPQHVHVGTSDNRLLVDLDSEIHLQALRLELRRLTPDSAPLIEEALPGAAQTWLPGSGGRYVSEIVVPLFRAVPDAAASGAPAHPPVPRWDRMRPPGSEWLYVKLYGPTVSEDELLVDEVAAFCGGLTEFGVIDEWFFIRYSDPEPHLRLRFRGAPGVLTGRLYPQFCAWSSELIRRDLCTRTVVDTYEREVERYGGTVGIPSAESVFCADSAAVLDILAMIRENRLDLDKTVLLALTTDDLLGGLGYAEDERHRWCRAAAERITEPGLVRREDVRELRTLLTQRGASDSGHAELNAILDARRARMSAAAEQLAAVLPAAQLALVAGSLVHMHCNRLVGRDRAIETRSLATLDKARYGIAATVSRSRVGA
jgi:thiopeptide-type bacteriocin biosynthesis protein